MFYPFRGAGCSIPFEGLGVLSLSRPPLNRAFTTFTDQAIDAGVPVAVCSTSNERAVSTIVRVMLGEEVAAKMVSLITRERRPDGAPVTIEAKVHCFHYLSHDVVSVYLSHD